MISRETLRAMTSAKNVLWLDPAALPDSVIKAANPRHPGESPDAYLRRLYLDMGSPAWANRHDEIAALRAFAELGNDGSKILGNIGKHWVRHAPKGRSHLMGWWQPERGKFIQEPAGYGDQSVHDDCHVDYSSTVMVEQIERDLIARGLTNNVLHVRDWQSIIGVAVDGAFGPATERATIAYQRASGLTPDGIVGRYTWAMAGEHWYRADTTPRHAAAPPVSPAVRRAMLDADKAWPKRNRASDGTLGDASHQARKSDHNDGNAFDITHDPGSGANGELIARMALADPRTAYVIWNRRIANVSIQEGAWRPYTGSNPHTHHVHVSIRPSTRLDDSPWPWGRS